ncbi:hypothetical protein MACJ_002263 [Theileria orientalis]|uniref:Uncharacterized protein n=1 Tax=Theileria orientalis TaxID=68886 RepID=A0A976M5W8_THEOR|nr:hypothetical protein MACJ_002263 [Theileria orientalis]
MKKFWQGFKYAFRLRTYVREKWTWADVGNLFFLTILYVLQGIPLGLWSTIPILLNDRASNFKIGLMTLATLPFSLKLLWAPVMEYYYLEKLGKRKTWVVFSQILSWLLLLFGSFKGRMDRWLFPDHLHIVTPDTKYDHDQIKLFKIFLFFFILCFLVATQDTALDSWAIAMLRPRMRVHAAFVNSLGNSVGFSLPFFLILISSRFFHKFTKYFKYNIVHHTKSDCRCHPVYGKIPEDHLVTVSGFMHMFCICMMVATLVVFVKREKPEPLNTDMFSPDNSFEDSTEKPVLEEKMDVESGADRRKYKLFNSYGMMMRVLKLKPVKSLAFILLTKYLFFAPEIIIDLKMMKYGLTHDLYGFLKSFSIVADVIFPFLIAFYISRFGYTNTQYYGLFLRYISLVASLVFLVVTKYFFKKEHDEGEHALYFVALYYILVIRKTTQLNNVATEFGLFNKVSDQSIVTFYVALLKSLSNLGIFYPSFLSLILVDLFTISKSWTRIDKAIQVDGVYVLSAVAIICGLKYLTKYKPKYRMVNYYNDNEWRIVKQTK